ncbi:amidase [Nocardioides albidus]|uniref:Amidase n=1 Tax=Nocardioides albidus TaxID=1517589 RepID=A0A5C4VNT1_9ACTN|nr:amidase [Nocardioides albidus]TNM37487.1 amidase [Nocardioides albidus]
MGRRVSDLWRPWSLRELVADLRSGRTTPEAAWERARGRIAETEHDLHAWVTLEPTQPSSLPDAPLAGVPLGVKDIIDVAGLPTRCGSGLRAAAAPAAADAAIVAAWRQAGAVPAGKTVTTEFAFFAPGPTVNPAAPDHTPGGSSSGSAAAVASGQVPLALGSQTAGSVTRPAAYCGVASLVMSHGRFPVDGVTGLSHSLDSHGVYAANVADLALAFAALTGEPQPTEPPAPPRVLIWTAAPLGVVAEEMSAALDSAARSFTAAGAVVDAFPAEDLIAEVTRAHPVVMAYEAARERAAELAAADRLSTPLADLLRTGRDTPESAYEAARATIAAAAERLEEVRAAYDVVVGPAAPGAAPHGLAATGDPVLSRAWQALGLPALTIPGLRSGGLPLGLQAIGRSGQETDLLAAGDWLEAALALRSDPSATRR